jgi:hypothetical protein
MGEGMGAARARFTVTVEGGHVVSARWAPGIVLRDTDGASLTDELRATMPGQRVHLVMFLNGMVSLSQDALAFFARRAPLSAVALVGPSVLDQALIELYLEVYAPPFPVGYFDGEPEARSWLALQPTT